MVIRHFINCISKIKMIGYRKDVLSFLCFFIQVIIEIILLNTGEKFIIEKRGIFYENRI